VRKENSEVPQWVYRVPSPSPRPDTAIVFVHGIFGGTLTTWHNPKANTDFYDLLSKDPKYDTRFDIFAFGFTSNYLKPGSFSILQAATQLRSQLQHQRVFDYQRVVFVAHSMGGLVVMRMLLDNKEYLQPSDPQKIPLVFLFSTPQEGSQIAVIARRLLNNPALAEMLPDERSDFIYQLDRDWKKTSPTEVRPHLACAYETLNTFGVRIVSWPSATRFCDSNPEPVGADHIDIVKPSNSTSDSSYVALANALDNYVPALPHRDPLTTKLRITDNVDRPDGNLRQDFVAITVDAYSSDREH